MYGKQQALTEHRKGLSVHIAKLVGSLCKQTKLNLNHHHLHCLNTVNIELYHLLNYAVEPKSNEVFHFFFTPLV